MHCTTGLCLGDRHLGNWNTKQFTQPSLALQRVARFIVQFVRADSVRLYVLVQAGIWCANILVFEHISWFNYGDPSILPQGFNPWRIRRTGDGHGRDPGGVLCGNPGSYYSSMVEWQAFVHLGTNNQRLDVGHWSYPLDRRRLVFVVSRFLQEHGPLHAPSGDMERVFQGRLSVCYPRLVCHEHGDNNCVCSWSCELPGVLGTSLEGKLEMDFTDNGFGGTIVWRRFIFCHMLARGRSARSSRAAILLVLFHFHEWHLDCSANMVHSVRLATHKHKHGPCWVRSQVENVLNCNETFVCFAYSYQAPMRTLVLLVISMICRRKAFIAGMFNHPQPHI